MTNPQTSTQILFYTVDPSVLSEGKPLSAMTTLLHRVCDNNPDKFEEATRIVELFIKASLDASDASQPIIPKIDVSEISRKYAGQAMIAIGNAQMHTWNKFPNSLNPTDMIAEAIYMALREAGVKNI